MRLRRTTEHENRVAAKESTTAYKGLSPIFMTGGLIRRWLVFESGSSRLRTCLFWTLELEFSTFQLFVDITAEEGTVEMCRLDPQAAMQVQPELIAEETLHWAGTPNPRVIFHGDDWETTLVALLVSAFSLFWEADALGYVGNGSSPLLVIFGIPFVLLGQYWLWVRFLVDAWIKRRTYYAVTNRRVLIMQEGLSRKSRSCFYLEGIPDMTREGTAIGTLWLGPKHPLVVPRHSHRPTRNASRFYLADTVPVLADIDDVESVHRLIIELQEQARKGIVPSQQVLSYPQS